VIAFPSRVGIVQKQTEIAFPLQKTTNATTVVSQPNFEKLPERENKKLRKTTEDPD